MPHQINSLLRVLNINVSNTQFSPRECFCNRFNAVSDIHGNRFVLGLGRPV